MSEDIKLEDLLDSVADAVSALVLFASEVTTDKKKLANLQAGIAVVQQATNFFTADAQRTIQKWREFHHDGMSKLGEESIPEEKTPPQVRLCIFRSVSRVATCISLLVQRLERKSV